MSAPEIKGWCPGAWRPMQSGDGFLLRAKVVGPALDAERAKEIAAISLACGNGLIDLSQRAQLQLRGLSERTLIDARERLRRIGLLAQDAATESVQNFIVSPFAGIAAATDGAPALSRQSQPPVTAGLVPAIHAGTLQNDADEPATPRESGDGARRRGVDARDKRGHDGRTSKTTGTAARGSFDAMNLLAQLAREIANDPSLQALPGKFGFLIDDGSRPGLAGVSADIRIEACGDGRTAIVAGGAQDVAFIVPAQRATEAALALARAFLSLRKGREFELRRMRRLVEALGVGRIARETGLAPAPYHSLCEAAETREVFGAQAASGRHFAGVGAPSGRLCAQDLAFLAALAIRRGDGELRLSPWRALLLPCASQDDARAIAREAGERGLVADADDARLSVVSCPGAPECPQAQGETRAAAGRLAPLAKRLSPGGVAVHVSGCAKGCAAPEPARATLVAKHGRFDLIDNGKASDPPSLEALGLDEIEGALKARARGAAMPGALTYIRDGAEIYARSFATIRAEARLARFTPEEERVAVRVIHACGMVETADDIVFSPGMTEAAIGALRGGAPILCDSNMVAHGITRARLPAGNDVVCTLQDRRVPALAAKTGTTRSAAALELWRDRLAGAIVAIGNAPTALFRLLELLDEGAGKPAAIIGMPVGFVGAAESKEALLADGRVPCVIVRGRKGGSAMAAASINALASEKE